MGQADTLMLNSYSTDAVAASGMISQILMLITFLITIIHVGTNIRIISLTHDEYEKLFYQNRNV
jgi:Na+-driven multidrug efflux pump